MQTADGWAIIEDIGIDVRSVSPTRRAAIVNWLVTRAGIMIYSTTTDKQIEECWTAHCGDAKALPVKVILEA